MVLLRAATLISNGCIEKIDALFKAVLDDLSGLRLIKSPGMVAEGGVAKTHAPHAKAGNFDVCRS